MVNRFPAFAQRRRGAARGFTLVELLVVMAVILLLAALALPALIKAISGTESTKCLSNLRQVGFGYLNYLKDYDFWMPCAGNDMMSMYDPVSTNQTSYMPAYELPWFLPSWSSTGGFQYWYEAFQPYVNSSASTANAIKALTDPTNRDYMTKPTTFNPANPQPYLRAEQARLMGITACPTNPNAPVGYGYNYTAPFGNTGCYPNNRDAFMWNDINGGQHTSPVNYNGQPVAIPILWYQQSIHSSTLTAPSTQVGFCDTGRLTTVNGIATYNLLDAHQWVEDGTSNVFGYVRFPLMKYYWPPNPSNGSNGGLVRQYRSMSYTWRPVGRHNGKANCLMFDGSAKGIDMGLLCAPSFQWGDAACLYDNRPPNRPPASPLFSIETVVVTGK